jgi:hypothetical protein
MDSIRRQARIAGVLYVLLAISAPLGLLYVPGKLIVAGDATATAARLRASEWLLRIGIATELFHQILFVFLVLALYRLFKAVDETLARQMVALGALVSVPIVFLNAVNELAALFLVGGDPSLAGFDRPRLDALVYLFLHLHGQGIMVVAIFWGLWLFPFGMLVIRSGFMPRVLGVLLMVAGVAYTASSFTSLLLPAYEPQVSRWAMALETGELPTILWLLIWGARPQPAYAAAS